MDRSCDKWCHGGKECSLCNKEKNELLTGSDHLA